MIPMNITILIYIHNNKITVILHNNNTWISLRNHYKLITMYMNFHNDTISQSTGWKLYANKDGLKIQWEGLYRHLEEINRRLQWLQLAVE